MSECPASISGNCLSLTEGFTLCADGECDREMRSEQVSARDRYTKQHDPEGER